MLAEYIDGGLEPRERAQVEEHLADCGECYENFAETVRIGGTTAVSVASVAPARPRRALIYGLGAAAVIGAVALSLGPSLTRELIGRRTFGHLIQAVGTNRFAEARVSEEFSWGPRPSALRGGAESAALGGAAAADLAELAIKAPTAGSLRRSGVAAMAEGRIDDAISALTRALEADPSRVDSALALSAALIERFRTAGSTGDLERSLSYSTRSSSETPALVFNRALALELLGRRDESLVEWKKYVVLEQDDRWRAEGQAHIERLSSPK